MTEGLIPGKRKGLTCGMKRWDKIFLTNSIEKIIDEQMGSSYKYEEYKVLIIDCSNIEVKPKEYHQYRAGTYTLSDFEFVTNKIEPKYIKNIINGPIKYYESK